jgi:hypothetical protein
MEVKNKDKWIKWWNYPSVWKLLGVMLGAMGASILSAFFIPGIWCLFGVLVSCGIGGYFMRKMIPDVLKDLAKELE